MGMFKGVKRWLYGLLSAIIGGGAGAVASAFGPMLLEPEKFNINNGLTNVLKTMGITFTVSSIISVVLYLKQAPLPEMGDDTAFITKPKE